MNRNKRVTPKQIETLKANEIFVFSCRYSGNHTDDYAAEAREKFGAIVGQNQGLQGESYAIPTRGGNIKFRDIRNSVKTFTQFAAEHPELHFLVTQVGCEGGYYKFWEIAPLFRRASKLQNVSLPIEFYNELRKGYINDFYTKTEEIFEFILNIIHIIYKWIVFQRLKVMQPKALYKMLKKRRCNRWSLNEKMEWVSFFSIYNLEAFRAHYLVNNNTKCAYMIINNKNCLDYIKDKDINWEGFNNLPPNIQQIVLNRENRYRCKPIEKFQNGKIEFMWQVGPNERPIKYIGTLNSHGQFIEKLKLKFEE